VFAGIFFPAPGGSDELKQHHQNHTDDEGKDRLMIFAGAGIGDQLVHGDMHRLPGRKTGRAADTGKRGMRSTPVIEPIIGPAKTMAAPMMTGSILNLASVRERVLKPPPVSGPVNWVQKF
jgi:hypothetical protein